MEIDRVDYTSKWQESLLNDAHAQTVKPPTYISKVQANRSWISISFDNFVGDVKIKANLKSPWHESVLSLE